MSVQVTRQVRVVRVGPASPAVIRASAVGPQGPLPPPAGSDQEVQFNNNGNFGAIPDLKWDGSEILVGAITRFNAATLGGSVSFAGPDIVADVDFVLPGADGSAGQVLVTDGAGNLSFDTLDFVDLGDTPGALGSANQILQVNSGGNALEFVDPPSTVQTIGVSIDNGSDAITNGIVVDTRVYRASTITGLTLVASLSTTITVVVEKSTFANYPSFTIIGSITLSGAQKVEDLNFSGTLAADDMLRFRVSNAGSNVARRISAMLRIQD